MTKPDTTAFGRPFWLWGMIFAFLICLLVEDSVSAGFISFLILLLLWSEGELKWKKQ
jgi:hypothetical protein